MMAAPGRERGEDDHDALCANVLRGGKPLHPTHSATTITVADGKGGDVVISDEPYAEAKEALGSLQLAQDAVQDAAIAALPGL